MSTVDDIKALYELLQAGIITQEDYEAKKAELLSAPVAGAGAAPGVAQPTGAGAAAQATSDKSKIAAGLLALFLGTLGIHKFYLGYQKEGVIMLLVSIIGGFVFGIGAIVMAVIAIIEAIMYLTKSDAEFETIYVYGRKPWF